MQQQHVLARLDFEVAAGRPRDAAPFRGGAAGGVAVATRRLLGDWQHDVESRHALAVRLVGRRQPYQWIPVAVACIVRRNDWNALGLEDSIRGVPCERSLLRRRRIGRHVQALQALAGSEIRAVGPCGVLPEVGLADAAAVDRSIRVGDRRVIQRHGAVAYERGLAGRVGADHLRIDDVVGREDREDREVRVHAVHAEIVGGEDLVRRGLCGAATATTTTAAAIRLSAVRLARRAAAAAPKHEHRSDAKRGGL